MEWTTGVHRRVLPNGLTLLTQRDTSAPVVAVVTHVRAGYFDEPDEWVGISHILEHMFFKGTARRGPGEIARDTQLLGGYLNAATIYDKTVYYTVLPSSGSGLVRALDVQADALMRAALDEGELNRELEVVIQEAKRKLDTPPAVVAETLYGLVYPTHRMGRWRIGTEEGLRRLTRADVAQYYQTRYTPDRVIVALVGDLDCEQALDLASACYEGWKLPAGDVGRSPQETEALEPRARVITGDIARPIAAVGWRTVGTLHEDAPALDVAASLLGAGRGSRLYRAVRMPGLASVTQAIHYTPTEVGVFDLSLESDDDRLDQAVERSLEVVGDLGRRPPSQPELERVKALFAARWAHQFESMDGRAAALCEGEALGDYSLIDDLYHRTVGVTDERVLRVTKEYLDPARACAVMYTRDHAHTGLAERWPLSPDVRQADLTEVSAVVEPESKTGDRATRETVADYPGRIRCVSLAGVDLLVRPKRGAGLVTVLLHVPGVTAHENEATAGVTRLFARTTLRGAGTMNGEQLAQAAESLGGGITTSVSVDGVGWSMTVRAEFLSQAARLLRLVALEPSLLDADVSLERALQVSDARRMRDDMYQFPVQRVLEHAFEGDPYGLPLLGEPRVLEEVTSGVVRDCAGIVRSSRAIVAAVGDLDVDALVDGLAPLAVWPAAAEQTPATGSAEFGSRVGSERRDKEQSALAMAFPAVPSHSPERYALAVTATLLSGLAGRLFMVLRDRMSLAYTVAATPWLRRRGGAMIGYIATSPEREDAARDAMLAELERLVAEPVTEDELRRARNYAAGQVEIRQQHGGAVAGELLAAWVNGVIEELVSIPERLRAVTAEDVARVARRVFDSGERAEFVVRGKGG